MKREQTMDFVKMHGLGNDYVVIGNEGGTDYSALSMAVCNRRLGIGADGLLVILPSRVADFRMRIFNPDGSEAEMCGNGIRCAVKYFVESRADDIDKSVSFDLTVETYAGIRVVTVFREADGAVGKMVVDMGRPTLTPSVIPVQLDGDRILDYPLEVNDERYNICCVSVGNPHCVIFVDGELDAVDVGGVGSKIENHPVFPRRTNVEFVQVIGRGEAGLRVWERGVGETLACGTGACAAIVAGVLTGRLAEKAVVHLQGGDLEVHWPSMNSLRLTGVAATVFKGQWLMHTG
ncbi:MAG: diaminopimelate epimerase [bacterium]